MTKKCFVLDIEKNGIALDDPLLAIGYCYGEVGPAGQRARVISSGRICIARDKDRPLSEFWAQPEKKATLEAFDAEAVPEKEAMEKYIEMFNKLEIDQLLSDNPEYDYKNLDFLLHRYKRLGSRYTVEGKYREMIDVDSLMMGLPSQDRRQIEEIANAIQEHTHFPDQDATNVFWQYVLTCQNLKLPL